jgi:beta-alanine--pyruvate transaminase
LADDLERIVAEHGADRIAAVIVEPVAGSTGVLLPPVGYLERLRALCDQHGILLIFDEVITGFGRVGASFAAERYGVIPDIMTVAKGMTNGAVPMGAVFTRRAVHDAVIEGAASGIEFFHGYTYSGHPLACAAAHATLDIYRDEQLFARAASLAPAWEAAAHALKGEPHVIDVRTVGLVAGIELSMRGESVGARGFDVFTDCFKRGVLMRVTADTLAMSPPLIVDEAEIAQMFETLRDAIRSVA